VTPPARAATFALGELVERYGGQCGGDLQRRVRGFATLPSAAPDQLAFVAAPRYRDEVASSKATARLWVCDDPYLQFAKIAQQFEAVHRPVATPGIAATAIVSADASIDASATIGPQVVIDGKATIASGVRIGAGSTVGAGSHIGADTLIHPRVVIYPGCTIGARCIIHAGAIIGADGFGFAKEGVRWVKIPQTGGVVIGDDVEIGANTTIDRGALDDTRIGNGVKLDNQIQVGHNVQIGDDSILAAFVGIAGSAVIGKRCMIGGAARIMGHVTIVDDTVVSTQTFVSRSITKAGQYTGYYPMAEHAAFEKSAAVLRRLERLRERVRRLEANKHPTSEPERPA
jgi:UDP-3-O-[3-hydroxymyristoyl] glucosamine N-acyltransferase